MELGWGYFRQLYEGLLDHDAGVGGRRAYLSGQRPTAAEYLAELEPLRKRERIPAGGYSGDDEQLWRIMKLYGLSRVSDYLIERFCTQGGPPTEFGAAGERAVTKGGVASGLKSDGLAAHTEFFSGIGLTPFDHAAAFSPFHHEVFTVVQDPSATSVTVEEVLWPGLWFGDLLFSRAGVRVRAPRHLIDATAATTSTLYFTFRRQSRPTDDLSQSGRYVRSHSCLSELSPADGEMRRSEGRSRGWSTDPGEISYGSRGAPARPLVGMSDSGRKRMTCWDHDQSRR